MDGRLNERMNGLTDKWKKKIRCEKRERKRERDSETETRQRQIDGYGTEWIL